MSYDREVIDYIKKLGFPLLYIIQEHTDEICIEAFQQNIYGSNQIKYVKNKKHDLCLIAVQQDGMALQHIKHHEQTEEICLEAVKQNGLALQFVGRHLKDYKISLAAVRQNGLAIQYVDDNVYDIELFRTEFEDKTNDKTNDECNICLSKNNIMWCKLKCNHTFHIKCLLRWIKENKSCPNCRVNL